MNTLSYNYKSKTLSIILCICLFISTFSLTGCQTTLSTPVSVTDFKLNTYVSVSAYTTGGHSRKELNSILDEAISLCDYYEKIFSRTMSESTLSSVNSGELHTIPKELGELIEAGIYYSDLSDGLFDITIGSVSKLWDFTGSSNEIPSDADIKDALSSVNCNNITLSANLDGSYYIDIPEGTTIDLGAVAKGYIADRIKEFLLSKNINSALINLGGNILCVGNKNSKPFNVGIKKPFGNENETILTLSVDNKSVVSSGNYERYFYKDNQLYHHILNSFTGYPHNNGVSNVTIISDDSLTGDCLSTTCFMLGIDKGLELINSLSGVEAMFVDDEDNIHYSDNFKSFIN